MVVNPHRDEHGVCDLTMAALIRDLHILVHEHNNPLLCIPEPTEDIPIKCVATKESFNFQGVETT